MGSQKSWDTTEQLSLITIDILCILFCRVSAEKSAMGIFLYVIWCFTLVAFNIFSLHLIFINLVSTFLCVFLLQFILAEILFFLTWVTVSYLEGSFQLLSLELFSQVLSLLLGPQ